MNNKSNQIKFLFSLLAFVLYAIHEAMAAGSIAKEINCPEPSRLKKNWDYNTEKGKFANMEEKHFPIEVESLIHGSTGSLGGDINYVLTVFPNHHRALDSLQELAIREKTQHIHDMPYSVPCYFFRASNFRPGDGLVSAIYAKYLSRIGMMDLAKSEAGSAIKKNPNNPRVAYNVGLTYYYLGDYKSAKEYSDMAKKLGSSAVGLDNLLSKSAPQTHR